MPSRQLANKTENSLSAHQAAKPPAKTELKVTPKVRTAIEAMVWQGLPRKQAAEAAGISEHGLYKALRKPPVKALYLSEMDVLRTSERARNFHVLCEVRDQTANQMARVNAVKALEQVDDDTERKAASRTPGVVIQIVQQGPAVTSVMAHEHGNAAKPLITNDHVPDDDGNDV